MVFDDFAHALGKLLRYRSPEKEIEGISSSQRIRSILRRERSRGARTGEGVAVISFRSRGREKGQGGVPFLAKACRQRLRVTDEIGWLDDKRLCAILPATTAEGAWRVADDVCRLFPENTLPPVHRAFLFGGCRQSAASGKPASSSPLARARQQWRSVREAVRRFPG